MLAEDLRTPKGKKLPRNWVGQKKKAKNKDKRIRMEPAPLGGSCEGGKVSHNRKPLHWWGQGMVGGICRATEESTAIGVQRAKQRDSRIEDQC